MNSITLILNLFICCPCSQETHAGDRPIKRGVPFFKFPDEIVLRVSTIFGIAALYFQSDALYNECTNEDFEAATDRIREQVTAMFDRLDTPDLGIFSVDTIQAYRKRRLIIEIDASYPIQMQLRSYAADMLRSVYSSAESFLLFRSSERLRELSVGETELTRLVTEYLRSRVSPSKFHGIELNVSDGLTEISSVFPKRVVQFRHPQEMVTRMSNLTIWEFCDWNELHGQLLFTSTPPVLPYSSKMHTTDKLLKMHLLIEADGTIIVGCKTQQISVSLLVSPKDKYYMSEKVREKAIITRRRPKNVVNWTNLERLCISGFAFVC